MTCTVERICHFCKWYGQGDGDDRRPEPWCDCQKTVNGGLGGFPFNKRMKCFEEIDDGQYRYI